MNAKNLIVPGITIAALLAMFLLNEEAKADPIAPGPKPPNPPTPPAPPVPTPPVPTPPLELKKATIDVSTVTPGQFAAKYGGDWTKWKEIASVNPGMIVVDKPYLIESTGQTVYTSGPPQNQILPYPGLIPWNMGQVVNIPPTW
jgi:hypothetical protein